MTSEWKTNTKKKSRELKKSLDNGIDSKIYLRHTEERLMNLIQKHSSDSLLEDSKLVMQHNNNLNFNLSDFCEVCFTFMFCYFFYPTPLNNNAITNGT